MSDYDLVNVTPDTPEWLEERRKSVGASEVAAVMGLDPWQTALDVYKSKQGIDRDFDPLIALVGHEDERTMSRWLTELSGMNPNLEPGFMARSKEHPFIHATPDRMWDGIPVQLKTAHEFTSHKWDEGIPTQYRVQVQAEMLVTDAPRALLVVRIGARDFRAIWEPRDNTFLNEYLIPAVRDFWELVKNGTPPPPQTVGEINDVWPSESLEVELSEQAFDTLERITVLNSDLKAQEEERDALKVALAQYVQSADTLLFEGRKVATWKTQKGRQSLDRTALEADHPDIVAAYTRQGADFKVLRTIKQKEQQ